jgi:hypothetical protein
VDYFTLRWLLTFLEWDLVPGTGKGDSLSGLLYLALVNEVPWVASCTWYWSVRFLELLTGALDCLVRFPEWPKRTLILFVKYPE